MRALLATNARFELRAGTPASRHVSLSRSMLQFRNRPPPPPQGFRNTQMVFPVLLGAFAVLAAFVVCFCLVFRGRTRTTSPDQLTTGPVLRAARKVRLFKPPAMLIMVVQPDSQIMCARRLHVSKHQRRRNGERISKIHKSSSTPGIRLLRRSLRHVSLQRSSCNASYAHPMLRLSGALPIARASLPASCTTDATSRITAAEAFSSANTAFFTQLARLSCKRSSTPPTDHSAAATKAATLYADPSDSSRAGGSCGEGHVSSHVPAGDILTVVPADRQATPRSISAAAGEAGAAEATAVAAAAVAGPTLTASFQETAAPTCSGSVLGYPTSAAAAAVAASRPSPSNDAQTPPTAAAIRDALPGSHSGNVRQAIIAPALSHRWLPAGDPTVRDPVTRMHQVLGEQPPLYFDWDYQTAMATTEPYSETEVPLKGEGIPRTSSLEALQRRGAIIMSGGRISSGGIQGAVTHTTYPASSIDSRLEADNIYLPMPHNGRVVRFDTDDADGTPVAQPPARRPPPRGVFDF